MKLFFLLVPLLLSASSQATTLVRFDLAQLVANAQTVFVGTCLATEGFQQDGQPFTRLHFAVQEPLKGEAQQEITVVLPGGRAGQRQVFYAGMPRFVPDEEVVLFLTEANAQGHRWPVGLAQGKFAIRRQAHAAKASVHQSLKGISFYGGAAKTAPIDGIELSGIELTDFLRRVRLLVNNTAPSDAAR